MFDLISVRTRKKLYKDRSSSSWNQSSEDRLRRVTKNKIAFAIHGSGNSDVKPCRTTVSTWHCYCHGLCVATLLMHKPRQCTQCRLNQCSADALSRARQRLIKSARRPGADLDVKINKINKKYKNGIYFQCLTVHLRMKK